MAAAVDRHRSGRLADAEALYRRILEHDPSDVEALTNLGAALRAQGRIADAVHSLRRAIALKPDYAGAHNNLGNALQMQGDRDGASAAYRASLACDPNQAEVHCNLGAILIDRNEPGEAETSLRQALALKPDFARAHYNLGRCRFQKKAYASAVEAYEAALRFEAGNAGYQNDLGNALFALDRLDEALSRYEAACRSDPKLVPSHVNRANTLFELMRIEDAIAGYDRALALDPAHAEARCNRALALLLTGRFSEGFAEYEWRWRKPGFPKMRDLPAPAWEGELLSGKTILLHAEQGLGDTIHFARYAPRVKARGGHVVFECPPSLARLLRTVEELDVVVAQGEPLPAFDVHAPLLSLPRIFKTTPETIPGAVPYLTAPKTKPVLPPRAGRRRIGIAWAGNPANVNDRKRSVDPALFAPLLARADIVILQVGPEHTPVARGILSGAIDIGDRLVDFAATAAVLAELDLVITVDTALAHLAGALAVPVWTLVPFRPDWRWQRDRTDSPWYPSMRLFRQERRGDWSPVFARVLAQLSREPIS